MAKRKHNATSEPTDPMTAVLATFRSPERAGFEDAWVGIEPTFSTKKAVEKWAKMSAQGDHGEDAYFKNRYMLRTQRRLAERIVEKYRAWRKRKPRPACCMFRRVELEEDLDPWKEKRQNLHFHWKDSDLEDFEVKVTLDPEIFEYSIKPVPLAWLYEERFVDFLQVFVWDVPLELGLRPSMAQGGAQFSISAKTFLRGCLLADDIADRLNHPELSTWIMDWPNQDDRAFRATRARFEAFKSVLAEYRAGAFHPRAAGIRTVEDALFDRGFESSRSTASSSELMAGGPIGDPHEVFQTNFAFGRAVRLRAQNVHPGYWQAQHPKQDGYRPGQIMRYGEANLNRLQIAGELHVKSGLVLDEERVPELVAPVEASMLATEASYENRGQMGRTSARDLVEAVLLDVHHARFLESHPGVTVKDTIFQDRILMDAEETLMRNGGARTLARLRAQARENNLQMSAGRIKSDWIEPETLLWAAWHVLPASERVELAREVVLGFAERVERAASVDPRRRGGDPMEPHRHRVHPSIWDALRAACESLAFSDPVRRELEAYDAKREEYLSRRPVFSLAGDRPPWDG